MTMHNPTEDDPPREPIPGEFDPGTHIPLSQPMGEELGHSDPDATLDEETRRERRKEGGGRG